MTQQEALKEFIELVRARDASRTMTALIVDSPWLPGYAGVPTMDFLFDPSVWLDVYSRAQRDLDGAVLIPGAWVELGMAAEPTGFGSPVSWNLAGPPDLRPHPAGLAGLSQMDPPDPEKDGLMPVILRQYERLAPEMRTRGFAPRIAGARGPLAVASHLLGITDFLMATQLERDACLALLDRTTANCIAWLKAQLKRMDDPAGVLVLDDLVGMLGPEDAEAIAFPCLKRVFDAFPGLIHIFHNDTPNDSGYGGLAGCGVDVFNFSHETDILAARAKVGPDVVLMGNLPPLALLVRGTPAESRAATEALLDKLPAAGPILVSPGGGVSPGTRLENLQAVIGAVRARMGG
jgi:uroporphyrinogen decarboxylase